MQTSRRRRGGWFDTRSLKTLSLYLTERSLALYIDYQFNYDIIIIKTLTIESLASFGLLYTCHLNNEVVTSICPESNK